MRARKRALPFDEGERATIEPLRQSVWTLSDALADNQALVKLEARPMRALNARAHAMFRVALDAAAKRKVGRELLAAGFRRLGTSFEHTTEWRGLRPYETFVDADHTTYAIVRRHVSLRSLIFGLSRYFIVTTLADGTYIETVSRRQPVFASEGRYVVRAGHDDLARDVAEHMAYVRERVMREGKIIPVRTLADVARLKRLYVGHVISESTADAIIHARDNEREMSKAVAFVLLLIFGIAIWLVRR